METVAVICVPIFDDSHTIMYECQMRHKTNPVDCLVLIIGVTML